MGWLQIVGTVIGIIMSIVATIFWVVTRKSMSQIKVLPNSPFIEIDNSRTRFTNGYSFGILKKMLPRKNKTMYIEFYPIDVTQGENIDRPEIQKLIVAKEFIKYPKKSARRQVIQTISRSLADIPDELRDTDHGNNLANEGQNAFIEKAFSDSIPSGDERVRDIIIKSHRGLGKVEINTLIDQAKINNQINNPKRQDIDNK